MTSMPVITKAVAVLHATKIGGEAEGKVTFTKVEGGVEVEAEITRTHTRRARLPHPRVRRRLLARRDVGRRPLQPR